MYSSSRHTRAYVGLCANVGPQIVRVLKVGLLNMVPWFFFDSRGMHFDIRA